MTIANRNAKTIFDDVKILDGDEKNTAESLKIFENAVENLKIFENAVRDAVEDANENVVKILKISELVDKDADSLKISERADGDE